ncbi:hypothetical protein [Janthinobacterium sp. DSP2-3-3]|uniref:hypothetical protein n=1 Tax=Janthinobacterium sp. DSP2-3-3 TaxID=2804596 RepID=UPI003CF1BFD2
MDTKKRVNASFLFFGHMNMNPSEVAAAPARTGIPKNLISAPPAAVVSMAMNAFQVVEMKKPAEAGYGSVLWLDSCWVESLTNNRRRSRDNFRVSGFHRSSQAIKI